jgi:adenine-specific DNA-methyltransferase
MSDARLICGDVLDSLKGLPDGHVDLVITSPPYNIGKEYENPRALDEYLDWCSRWMAEVHRVLSARGSFWLNLGYLSVPGKGRAVPLPYLLWDKSPFYLLQEIVWHYGAGVAARRAFSPRNEKWLWFVKDEQNYYFDLDAVRDPNVKYPNQKKNGKLKCNPLGKNPSDVWSIPKVTSGAGRASRERTPHPAQFPLAVVQRIILACSREGELVLDPFCGSGSTLVACVLNDRRGLGIEVRADYCAMAERRLRVARSRPRELALFG